MIKTKEVGEGCETYTKKSVHVTWNVGAGYFLQIFKT